MKREMETGGSGCCDWLYFVTQGARLVAPSNLLARAHHRPQQERRSNVWQDCVHSAGISSSSGGDRVTSYLISRLLILDDRAAPWGFHDATLVDMAGATGPSVSKEELSALRRQWPISVVTGMSKRQTDLELMCRDCIERFLSHPTGACTYCGRNIKHDMACHVSSFHLDLGQLWRCPVSWCTQWKGTPHDCIDHICKKHNVDDSVKMASLGKWFPPWTVTRAEWHTALKSKVSGISTGAALFSEH